MSPSSNKEEPARPPKVPSEAVWNGGENEWELGEKNIDGKYVGEWRWWLAPKGHLCCHTHFDNHGKMLRFKRYHPNGQVSREGFYKDGNHNDRMEDIYYRSTEPTTEHFAYPYAPTEAWKAVKRPGYPVEFDYYDKTGNHLNPTPTIADLSSLIDRTDAEKSEYKSQLEVTKQVLYDGALYCASKGNLPQNFVEMVLDLLPSTDKDDESLALAKAVLEECEEAYDEGGDTMFYKGDLEILDQGGLDLEDLQIANLIVHGNLYVSGGGISLLDDPLNLLLVTGHVTADNVVTSGGLVVGGNLTVKGCLFGDYNHGSTHVFGNASAQVFHPEEYYFGVEGDTHFDVAFGNSWRLNSNQRPQVFNFNTKPLRDLVNILHEDLTERMDLDVDVYLDSLCSDNQLWDYLDRHQVHRYVLAGRQLLGVGFA